MSSILLTAPAVEPLTLAEAKSFLCVAHGDDDDLIAAARGHVETATRRALIAQSWRLVRDVWPADGRICVTPAPLVRAVRLLLAHWYEHRGIVVNGQTGAPLPLTVRALPAPFRPVSL